MCVDSLHPNHSSVRWELYSDFTLEETEAQRIPTLLQISQPLLGERGCSFKHSVLRIQPFSCYTGLLLSLVGTLGGEGGNGWYRQMELAQRHWEFGYAARTSSSGWPLPPVEVCELTGTMGGTMGRRALEGNGRINQEGNRRWESGSGKAPGGEALPCRPSGTSFSCSAINPLLEQRTVSKVVTRKFLPSLGLLVTSAAMDESDLYMCVFACVHVCACMCMSACVWWQSC